MDPIGLDAGIHERHHSRMTYIDGCRFAVDADGFTPKLIPELAG